MKKRYLTQDEVADRYRGLVSVRTLANWRSLRIGQKFTKIGKTVLYEEGDWMRGTSATLLNVPLRLAAKEMYERSHGQTWPDEALHRDSDGGFSPVS